MKFRGILQRILAVCLIVTIFAPLAPQFPSSGLDPSWKYAMNQAVHDKLVFGRDIIFTFGPYAAVYTKEFNPATNTQAMVGTAVLSVSFIFMFDAVLASGWWSLLILLFLFFSSVLHTQDPILFSYPLLLALYILRVTRTNTIEVTKPNLLESGKLVLLFSGLALLPLIKGSLLILSVGIGTIGIFYLWRYGCKLWGIASLAALICFSELFWCLAGNEPSSLIGFYSKSFLVIKGFTEAMSISSENNILEVLLYVISSICILWSLIWQNRHSLARQAYLFYCFSLILFVAFKAGFVRHDEHALIAGASLITSSLLLHSIGKTKQTTIAVLLAILTWGLVEYTHGTYQPRLVAKALLTFAHSTAETLRKPQILHSQFDQSIARIKSEYPLPLLEGPADIYSYNQSVLIASGNTWSPRPTLQSFQAYNPDLQNLNRNHLLSVRAPQNIFFSVEPIDNHFPAIEDGNSWPLLWELYVPVSTVGKHVLLRRRPAALSQPRRALLQRSSVMGEAVQVGDNSKAVLAQFNIRPSFAGKVASLLFKPPEVQLNLSLSNGRRKSFRIIPGMVATEFLLSPVVETTQDFVYLTDINKRKLDGNRVVSLSISTGKFGEYFWATDYDLKLTETELPSNTDASKVIRFDKAISFASYKKSAISLSECHGDMTLPRESVGENGSFMFSNSIFVEGWIATHPEEGKVPDEVFLTLRNGAELALLIKARGTPRHDVKTYFNRPEMPDVGFEAVLDVSKIKGTFTLGVAQVANGRLEFCPQFDKRVVIDNAQH